MSPSIASHDNLAIHDDAQPNLIVDDTPAKISAYYSLVFPDITFYLQTLTVTIGRRCIPPSSSSANGADGMAPNHSSVDVDLGPLKSVSRLHARIEYEEEEERFVLVVIGRNGAWVDGVWSGAGSRVPLGQRSQIQIVSRTFQFVLPPPPAPEDSPSPSSNSSIQRARSPSVDITSISPPSSLPSHSPPPREAPPFPPPKRSPSPEPQLPNSNAIPRSITKSSAAPPVTPTVSAPTSKKRKKLTLSLPKPEVMPPKPPFTYAQLCYRAIKAMGGKATLQDICGWMMENYDWYRYNEGAGWENSVRHNLSSGRAFKKMERSTGEHGKGFFWSVDRQFEHTFEEQEAKAQAHAQSLAQGQAQPRDTSHAKVPAAAGGKDGKRKKGTPADPPLKRSVKNGNGPLPPPLTSTPLPLPSRPTPASASPAPSSSTTVMGATPPSQGPGEDQAIMSELARIGASVTNGSSVHMPTQTPRSMDGRAESSTGSATPAVALASTSNFVSPLSSLPASVRLPVVVGTAPLSNSSASCSVEDPPPIALHDNRLVLSPLIFSSLTPEQLGALEEMGAQRALEVLQAHIVRYLKERMGRRKKRKASGEKKKEDGKAEGAERLGPFTSVPLPRRGGHPAPQTRPSSSQSRVTQAENATVASQGPSLATQWDFRMAGNKPPASHVAEEESVPVSVDSKPPVPVPITLTSMALLAAPGLDPERPASPLIVVDEDRGRVAKRRRVDVPDPSLAAAKARQGASPGTDIPIDGGPIVEVVQPGDEDIEVDIC